MFKNIFNWVILIISQPGKAWDTLSKKEEKTEDFLEQFLTRSGKGSLSERVICRCGNASSVTRRR